MKYFALILAFLAVLLGPLGASWVSATEGVSLNEGESNCSDPSASCVKLRVNGITREKVLLDEGDEITITCSGPFQHRIQLLKIGQKTTFEEQAMAGNLPANVSLKYEPLKCNGSQASGNCSKVVVMTATPEMDKKAYQCRTIIPGATDVYSRGVYINVIKIPTTSPQQDPSPSGTHVPPSATNGQPTSTESPPIDGKTIVPQGLHIALLLLITLLSMFFV